MYIYTVSYQVLKMMKKQRTQELILPENAKIWVIVVTMKQCHERL